MYDKTCITKQKSNNIFHKKNIPIKFINNIIYNNLRIYKKFKNDLRNIIRKFKNDFYTKSLDKSKSIKTRIISFKFID